VIADDSNDLDTELRVRNACMSDESCWPLHQWLAIKDIYTEPKITVWISDERVRAAAAWLKAHHGLCWTSNPTFGAAVSGMSALPFYHQGAKDRRGRSVLDHKRGTGAIVSLGSCSTDLDGMQKIWNKNLYVSPPASGDAHEQSLARTHRHGQTENEVHVTYWIACRENIEALKSAREKESAVSVIENRQRKLLIAEWTLDRKKGTGEQWQKSR
jgi:hypothetical protein